MKSPAHEESGGSPLLAVETVWRDIARGVRHLWRKPAFTLAAVISLGLGIGANTLIFGVLNGTLLKPLAVQDPDRLVVVWTVPDQNAPEQLSTSSVSRYFHFRDHSRSFESVAAFNGAACGVRTLGFDRAGVPVERIFGQTVSPSLFRVLGVVPLLGRTFTDAEDQVDNVAPVALLTYRSWQRRFSADQGIVGKIISLNRTPTTIIGVLRPEFDLFGDTVEFVAPLCLTRAQVEGRLGGNTIIARLKSGVSTAQAQAEADAIAASLAVADPERHRGFGIRIESLQRAQARILDRTGQPASDVGFPLLDLVG